MWRSHTLWSNGERNTSSIDDKKAERKIEEIRLQLHRPGEKFWANRFSILVDQPGRFIAIRAHSFDVNALVIEILERQ